MSIPIKLDCIIDNSRQTTDNIPARDLLTNNLWGQPNMTQKLYQHKDLYLCAFLLLQNCELIKHERIGNCTLFTFIDSDNLRKHVSEYYSSNGNANAMAFAATIRNIKSMIHSNRVESGSTLSTCSNEDLNNEFNNNHGEKL